MTNLDEWAKRREERQFEKMTLTHVCAECGAPLVTPYSPELAKVILVCGQNRSHKGFVKQADPVIERLEGMREYTSDEVIDKEIEGYQKHEQVKYGRRQVKNELGTEKGKALQQYQGVMKLTYEEARYILQTIWPQAPEVELLKAAMICQQYGLNPLMKHLYLLEFQGKGGSKWAPVLGIQATRLIASRNRRYGYQDGPRLMTRREQEEILGKVDGNTWAITILEDAEGHKAPGYGVWPKLKTIWKEGKPIEVPNEPYGMDKGNTEMNMAFIRSERNALDRLLPGEMPQGIEVADMQYMQLAPGVKENHELLKPSTQDLGEDWGPEEEGENLEGICLVHKKSLVSGKYGPYCPTRIKDGKGKEVWCKGKEMPQAETKKTRDIAPQELPATMPKIENWGFFGGLITNAGISLKELLRWAGVNALSDFASYEEAWEIAKQIEEKRVSERREGDDL